MHLVSKILKESNIQNSTKMNNSNLYFHGGNLDKIDYEEIIVPKKGRFEYGIGLYLTTSREVADKYSKGSRKLYLVELEDNIVDLNNVKVNAEEVKTYFKSIISKNDYIIFQNSIDKVIARMNSEEINLGTINIILLNNDILKPKYAKDVVKYFASKGADAYIDDNTFGWGEATVVLFNFKKIKSVKNISKNDSNYFKL